MRLRYIGILACTASMTLASASHAQDRALVCGVTPSCDAAPTIAEKKGFLASAPQGSPYHFGKDFYLNAAEDQWVIAKFQYGNYLLRQNLVHEEVEIQLLRDCGTAWESLGKAYTSAPGENPEAMHAPDEGGMVYFKIPEDKRLGLGRHRIRLVVSGDQTSTELFLEILPPNSTLFVSDVDGTLTKGELSELAASIFNKVPPAHPGAAVLFNILKKKGYHPLYLTARSTNLVERTREFIDVKKFPAGIITTSPAKTFGLSGDKAIAYKSEVLQGLEDRGFNIAYGFGNTKVDAGAFANIALPDSGKYFFKFDKFSDFGGGTDFDDYTVLPEVAAAQDLCI